MRFAIVFLGLACVSVQAQVPGWRQSLMGWPAQPTSANIGDLQRFEANVRGASPYFARLTAADYMANRVLMRNMVSYLVAADLMAKDPQTRAALARAYYALAALRWVYPLAGVAGAEPPPPPPGKPAPPPFELSAPEIKDVAAADKETADDLRARYDTSAARAAKAWQNAEVLRLSLEGNGMSLNTQTATAVARLQLFFELASGGLRAKDWMEAHDNLERAEYETEKVFRVVGR